MNYACCSFKLIINNEFWVYLDFALIIYVKISCFITLTSNRANFAVSGTSS